MALTRGPASRRFAALLTSAALLAALAVTSAAPVGAADEVTCRGKVATIVGTQGDDVLVGTPGRDIIAGLGGDDVIKGLGGHDLICAGRGADRVKGNQGRDRLYGNAGPDRLFGGKGPDTLEGGVSDDWLKGQKGDDSLDGGPGTDTCYQDQGSGSETSCELPATPVVVVPLTVEPTPTPKPEPAAEPTPTPAPTPTPTPTPPGADLSVNVRGADYNMFGWPLVYTVTVKNNGPVATTYELSPALSYDHVINGSCSVVSEPSGPLAILWAGQHRDFVYEYDCYGSKLDARLTAEVAPTGGVVDPTSGNDSDSHVTVVVFNG